VEENKKLGIIVPYRNREKHLKIFKEKIVKYLNARKIPYELIIVNQDNAKLFNRGMLLNIGFKIAEKLNCDYVVFHDVDMIPERVDYTYSDIPLHLATNFKTTGDENKNELFEEYFGGVTMFTMDDFRKIDGYSNKYWGWGYEDTDLLHRCRKNDIELDIWKIKNTGSNGPALKFNGINY
jgi:predicted glycosyltransferase involved in capsule biosynthesis